MEYKAYKGDSLNLEEKNIFFTDHVSRYWWANQYAENKTVLDCATGKGYGAYIMSHNAKSVMGVDLNEESLKIARSTFHMPNLEFLKWDAFKLEQLNKKFDIITAFEVIEHIDENQTDNFLSSISSALNKDGKLLISTPNHDVVEKSRSQVPHFHINNFPPVKLKKILSKHFDSVVMIGQYQPKNFIYNSIFAIDYFNFRHSLKNLFKPEKITINKNNQEEDSAENNTAFKILPAFQTKPQFFHQYKFSPSHWRQAGLTIAVCSNS